MRIELFRSLRGRGLIEAFANNCLVPAVVGTSPPIDLRALLTLPVALGRTTRPTFGRVQTGYQRQGCDRFVRGANAAVMSAMGGRAIVGVRRLAGKEEALLERMAIFPCRILSRSGC